MNRTHRVLYRNSAGSNFSFHPPEAPGGVAVGEALAPMPPAREAHSERMAEQGESIADANRSPAGFNREDLQDPESSLVAQLAIQAPANGPIRQAIPA
jgi:hypothetical protein